MSSIESQLLEYRSQKARERKKIDSKKETRPSSSQSSTGSNVSAPIASIPILSTLIGVLNMFRREEIKDNGQTNHTANRNLKGKENFKVDVLDDEDDDKLISKNCIVACSPESSSKQKLLAALPVILKITLWTVLWGLFIEVGFGAVYFVISLLIIMYYSMRTRPKKSGEMSAYSVFNPGVEKIDGTFTAEQFEKELRYGAAAVH